MMEPTQDVEAVAIKLFNLLIFEKETATLNQFINAIKIYGQEMVRKEMARCAEICLDEKVDADSTKEEGDYAYNRACDDCCAAIRADEKGVQDGRAGK